MFAVFLTEKKRREGEVNGMNEWSIHDNTTNWEAKKDWGFTRMVEKRVGTVFQERKMLKLNSTIENID